jgi:poly-beta-1,6-N-acetyl-D-glucosamine synthase
MFATILIVYFFLALSIVGFFWPYLIYPLTIFIISKFRTKPYLYSEEHIEKVSIIIPCYNEEKVIKAKLENTLNLQYPKDLIEVMCINDGSIDGTEKILETYQDRGIKVLSSTERRGKASALNYAITQTTSSIIVTTDADTFVDEMALKHMIKHFSDPNVGVVGGNSVVKSSVETEGVSGRNFLTTYESFLIQKESMVDSPVNIGGQLMAIRRNLAKFDESCLAEDFDCLMNARVNGFRVISEQKAYAYEYAPSTKQDAFKQQKRMSKGAIQTLAKYRNVLFNQKFGLFGVIILPGHRLSQVLNPLFLLLILILTTTAYLLAQTPLLTFILAFELCSLLIAAIAFKITSDHFLARYMNYFSIIQFSLITAWYDFVFKRSYNTKWEKIDSIRKNGIPNSVS